MPKAKLKPVVPKNPRGHPNKNAKARDTLRIARLFYAGKKTSEIAKLLDMPVKEVQEALDMLDAEWRSESKELVKATRQAMISELLAIKDEYYAEWERSKQDRVITSSKVSKVADDSDGTNRNEISKRTEQRMGDDAYLQGVERVLKEIAALVGLNAPQRFEHTGEDGKPLLDLSNLSAEQLAALASTLQD